MPEDAIKSKRNAMDLEGTFGREDGIFSQGVEDVVWRGVLGSGGRRYGRCSIAKTGMSRTV
jgi:hypothetical protein